jgi:hypothetical protein
LAIYHQRSWGLLHSDAIDVVLDLTIDNFFNQAMNVGIEAGELLVEHPGESKVFNDGFVESFPWDEERNPGWVWG